jgi:peptidoglycan/xylan/chitin deacetylase (PgdA/CDA1 family)
VDRAVNRRHVLALGAGALAAGAIAGCSSDDAAAQPPIALPPTTAVLPTTSATTGGPATQVIRGSGTRPEVALTFHGSGALSIAQQIHDILGAANARATIMAVGTWLASTPDGIKMFHDSGHDVGNHTWSHGVMSSMSTDTVLTEIERCRDKLAEIVGTPGSFFRQSSAQYPNQQELAEAGLAGYSRVLAYDIDGLDWKDPGPTAIRAAVATARAGSVVSLHLGHDGTVAALPDILRDLAARGLNPVTATDLLR